MFITFLTCRIGTWAGANLYRKCIKVETNYFHEHNRDDDVKYLYLNIVLQIYRCVYKGNKSVK